MPARDPQRRLGGTAEIDRDARLLHRPHLGRGALDAVIGALVVHRLRAGPDRLQDIDILVRPRIAVVLAEPVAVPRLVHVIAAGDHVDRGAAARKLVQRRIAPRREARRQEARPVRDQESHALRMRGRVGGQQEPVGSVAVPADQHAVEAALVMHPHGLAEIAEVDRLAMRRVDLRLLARLHHADELDIVQMGTRNRHRLSSFTRLNSPRAPGAPRHRRHCRAAACGCARRARRADAAPAGWNAPAHGCRRAPPPPAPPRWRSPPPRS